MCGICGEVRFNGGRPSALAVQSMTEVLTPRGPDSGGLFGQQRAMLGHRRLKVIDLSENAQQPMVDSTLGLVLVYNGALYNYPELRRELEGKGYSFFSHGDTEVVLKAYDAWGPSCVERFNGMFAFTIWHRATGTIFLARDRLGIKPLYYAEIPNGFRFASSLPALQAGGDVDTEIDPVALHHYMTFHSVVPAPRTILRGVRKLMPATWMTVDADGKRTSHTYWQLQFRPDEEEARYSVEDWQESLLDALNKAVQARLLADVPVGVLLSGGVDSSLIVALLAGAGQNGLHTFSIGFDGIEDEAGDEFQYSDIVASHFGTQHHKIRTSNRQVVDRLEECVRAMSEPMMSHDCIGFYLLSEAVAKHVKVVQSGQGADEVFAGYHWYPPLVESQSPIDDYSRAFFDRDHTELSQAVHPQYIGDNHSRRFVVQHFADADATMALDKALHLDTTVMLVEDPVKRVDNMTMAWGLEARVPFLDHHLVELAARMPGALKTADGGKGILKAVARRLVPREVIDRPKGYFPVPGLIHLDGVTLTFVRDLLTSTPFNQRQLFNRHYVDELLLDPKEHITPLRGSKLWQMAVLEYWFQLHNL
jgi:asparagine synthase (glutamine-hydrolysing)